MTGGEGERGCQAKRGRWGIGREEPRLPREVRGAQE